MAYYRVCPYFGAHLDPGERCDSQGTKSTAPEAATSEGGKGNNYKAIIAAEGA